MNTRKVLRADEGKILTNGEIYGRIIYLALGEDETSYHEISEEEYLEILKKQELENRPV